MLINVYAPNKDKDQVNFFNNLLQNENLDSVDNIILGGDLNCPLDPLLDKKGGTSTKTKSVISCIDGFKSYKRMRRGRAKNGRSRVHG